MYEIDRLKKKARSGEALTWREGLWLVEKVNQLRDALALCQPSDTPAMHHPLVRKMARERAEAAQLACCWDGVTPEPERGNESWTEWGLNARPDEDKYGEANGWRVVEDHGAAQVMSRPAESATNQPENQANEP